ncbi:MAG: formate--tetrahydrofolate ligase [Thermoplasmataceae archaeon]
MGPTDLLPIEKVAEDIGISADDLESYGRFMAKVDFRKLGGRNRQGKLILVTAMTPTKYGEGKTTTIIGLSQALHSLGKKVSISIREPSMGPCFGVKGGATGGGMATVEPSDRINLMFTGDFPAVTAAHNLLSTLINNHMFHGNALKINPEKIVFPRTMDMNDRSLRNIIVGVSQGEGGILAHDNFVITPASEIMAILGLSESYDDLKLRLSRILVAYSFDGKPVFSSDLKAEGAMAAILTDALKPNIVQARGGIPAFIHTGPFGNIAHGTSSIIAARAALSTSDIVITEAGFGSDLGAEKFMNLVSRVGHLPLSAVIIVATVRAIKLHGGCEDIGKEDVIAIRKGFGNLLFHARNIRKFGFEPIVALNRFPGDTDIELSEIGKLMKENNLIYAISDVYNQGAKGGIDLAETLLKHINDQPVNVNYSYKVEDTIKEKIDAIALKVYGAERVIYTKKAESNMKRIEKIGYGKLPICMAKTQYSISDDPTKLNAPEKFTATVTSVSLSSGAGFIVAYLGDIMTMPGLPKDPASNDIDITSEGVITGLSQ